MGRLRISDQARHIAMSTLKKPESGALYSSLFTAFGASSRTIAIVTLCAYITCRLLRMYIANSVPKRKN